MDSYLTEIKQLRIPRPKYEPNSSSAMSWHRCVRSFTPPRDYPTAVSPVGGENNSSLTIKQKIRETNELDTCLQNSI